MTKEEIAAMIAAKIEGQGTNVDAGSALPAILNGILELIPESDNTPKPLTLNVASDEFPITDKAEAATALGITPEQLDALLGGAYTMVRIIASSFGENGYFLVQPIVPSGMPGVESLVHFLEWDESNGEYNERYYLSSGTSGYYFSEL